MIEKLKQEIFRTEAFEKFRARLASLDRNQPLAIHGVAGSLMAFVGAAVYENAGSKKNQRQIVVVASDAESAATLSDDLELLIGSGIVRYFSDEHTHHTATEPVSIPQIETLRALARKESVAVVTHPLALLEKLPSPQSYSDRVIEIAVKAEVSFEKFLNDLGALGFEKKDFVEGYGDFALRGGIVDVFPYVGQNPIRLEFWGNTVESIREFDVLSQRSIKELQAVQIVPDLLSSKEGASEESRASSLFDYLSEGAILLLDDPEFIKREIEEARSSFDGDVFTWNSIEKEINRFPRIVDTRIQAHTPHPKSQIDFAATAQPSFNGSVNALYSNLQTLARHDYSICLLCDTQPLAERLQELIEEVETHPDTKLAIRGETSISELEFSHSNFQLPPPKADTPVTQTLHYQLLTETIHHGFVLPTSRIAVYTEHEIFGRGRRRGDSKQRRFKGFSLRDLQSLKRGDYVVHGDFGIGQFSGLEKIKVGNVEQEVMKLLYAEKDALYVNINHLNRVRKYSSKEGHIPKLSRLGSGEWDRLKERAKRKIKDIARDLIALYAARKKESGIAFSSDTH